MNAWWVSRCVSFFMALLPTLVEGKGCFLPVKVLGFNWIDSRWFVWSVSSQKILYTAVWQIFAFYLRTAFTSCSYWVQILYHLAHFPTTSTNEHCSPMDISIAVIYRIPSHFCTFVHISLPSVLFPLYFPLHLWSLTGCLWSSLILRYLDCCEHRWTPSSEVIILVFA